MKVFECHAMVKQNQQQKTWPSSTTPGDQGDHDP